jgi:two-component system, sensor histidine kinase PdtaS
MTAVNADRRLRAHIPQLREYLVAWLGDGADVAEDGDAQALLDALCAYEPARFLPRFEAAAQRAAEQGSRLETRMSAIRRSSEALAIGIEQVFAADLAAMAAAQARLARVITEVDAAFVRGYQAVVDRRMAEEAALAQRGIKRVQALRRITGAANSTMDLSETLQITARTVAEEMEADLCSVFLFDEGTRDLQLRATNGPRPKGGAHFTLMLGEGYTGRVAEDGHPLIVPDASADPQFARECAAYPTLYRGLLSMPIIFFTVEKLVGVISVQSAEPREFNSEEVSFLEVVAGQLAMNIENGRLYEQTDETLRRKVHELSTLHRVSALVASTLELNDVLQTIVIQAVQLSGADRSIIFDLDRLTQRLRPVASHGFEGDGLPRWGVMVGQCCAGRAVETGEPSVCLDCMRTDETCFFRDSPEAIGDQHSVLCVPLVSTHGSQGALCVFSAQRYLFGPQQLQLVVTFANVAAIAMENARLFEQTREGLKTKGVLLREMHHRVKNNLQQVASILSMQRRRATSPQAERILAESVGRIQGIAATHDLLSSDQLGMASVDDIARKIVGIVQANLVPPQLHLTMSVDPCPAHVPSEQATTLAIVLNELIANAIEHGFEGRTRGSIRISGAARDGTIIVRVADDGVGLPPGFDLEHSEGLGLQLVGSLVRSDLRGSFSLCRESTPVAERQDGQAQAGGDLQAEQPDEWTVAEVSFPAVLADEGDAEDAAADESEAVDLDEDGGLAGVQE